MTKPYLKMALFCLSIAVLAGCSGGSSTSPDDETPGDGAPDPQDPVALSGIISVEANTRVDLDTADSLIRSNPLPGNQAQVLPASVVMAGYVSGASGNYQGLPNSPDIFRYSEDPFDLLVIPMKPGQTLLLQTFGTRAGEAAVNLRLEELQNTARVLDQSVTDPGRDIREARVTLPADQPATEYLVAITTDGSVPVSYILSTVAGGSVARQSFDWPRHEFVPGEAIVSMSPRNNNAASAMSMSSARVGRRLGANTWHVHAPDSISQQALGGAATLNWVRELRKTPGVERAVPNYVVRSQQLPVNEPLFTRQWHYSLINAPTAWQFGPEGGDGVTVAVLDTGLFREANGAWHRDLAANVVSPLPPGADFVSRNFDNDGEPGPDSNPEDPGNATGSSVYHGTHVAGTVAATVNNSGGTGMAFGSSLLPVRVLGEGGAGSSVDLLAAIRWASGLEDNTPPKADIVNMSLGGLPFIPEMQTAITEATRRGVVFVAAAGNMATSTPSYPAAFDNVFSVSAVDGAGVLSSYSNFGDWIDLAAPGGDARRDGNGDGRADLVISTSASLLEGGLQPTYIGLQGTSMASPHVAGVFALMKNVSNGLAYAGLRAALESGELTDADGQSRNNALGFGLLAAGESVLAASSLQSTTVLSPSPSQVSLSSDTNPAETITLDVLGPPGSLAILDGPPSFPDWLDVSVSPGVNTEGAEFELQVELIEANLEPGVPVQGRIRVQYISDSRRTLEIPVTAQLINDELVRDAGTHFILLVSPEPDPESGFFEAVAQIISDAENGRYDIVFRHDDGIAPRRSNEVPPGEYFLVAGTDLDNDGIICQAGEACAEYPVTGLRQRLDIQPRTRLSGVELTTSYSRPTITGASADMLPRPDFNGYRLLRHSPDAVETDPKRRTE
jgi:serine protease